MSRGDGRALLAVDCPECSAEPGEPCYNESGTSYVDPHKARADELNKYVARAEEMYDAQGGPDA